MSPWCRLVQVRGRALFALFFVLVAGCGGGGGGPDTPRIIATVQGCGDVRLHDSGQTIYIVIQAGCGAQAAGEAQTDSRDVAVGLGIGGPDSAAAVRLHLFIGEESSPVSIPDVGTRRVGLFRAGQWRVFPNTDSWHGRDGAGLLVLDGALYLLGGWVDGPTSNEVWKTTDLEHWEFLGNAPWPARHGAAWLVHDSKLWVIGGDLYADVWSSPDGVHWTQETDYAPFGARYTPNAASLNGEIIVYAGQAWLPVPWCSQRPDCEAYADRSVWKSRDGRNWTQATPAAPWEGRGLIHGSIVHDGEIFLIGGGLKVTPPNQPYAETFREFTDIWSSPDGVTWRLRSPRFSFPGRTHFSVLSTPQGCYVSDGSVGIQDNLSNDLFFAEDCINFGPVPTPSGLGTRHASSVAYFNGSLVILGGPNYGTAGTAIWQYFP